MSSLKVTIIAKTYGDNFKTGLLHIQRLITNGGNVYLSAEMDNTIFTILRTIAIQDQPLNTGIIVQYLTTITYYIGIKYQRI